MDPEGKGPPNRPEQSDKAKLKLQQRAERKEAKRVEKAAKAEVAKENKEVKAVGKEAKETKGKEQSKAKSKEVVQTQTSERTRKYSFSKDVSRLPQNIQVDDASVRKKVSKKLEKQNVPERKASDRKVGLFSHLYLYEKSSLKQFTSELQLVNSPIHPAIIKLGLKYAEGRISGSNARCVAMLGAFRRVIVDYKPIDIKSGARETEFDKRKTELDTILKSCISYLGQCRTKSLSMGNAIKYLKDKINSLPSDISVDEAKKRVVNSIDYYVQRSITLPGSEISNLVKGKIQNDDTILLIGYSSLLRKIIIDAHLNAQKRDISFRVIVVDSRPQFNGKVMLRHLVAAGVDCSYILINAISYVMKEVSKVFLSAHALLANGHVLAPVGSAQVALVARAYNVPVLVLCERHKFSERTQTDAFVYNELGDPDDLILPASKSRRPSIGLSSQRNNENLFLLNFLYDVTPPELITMVVTEIGPMPCTSVPAVLRMRQAEGDEPDDGDEPEDKSDDKREYKHDPDIVDYFAKCED